MIEGSLKQFSHRRGNWKLMLLFGGGGGPTGNPLLVKFISTSTMDESAEKKECLCSRCSGSLII